MEALLELPKITDAALLLVLGSTRFAFAFLVLPLMPADLVPATCRNAIYVMFGLVAISLQPSIDLHGLTPGEWAMLFGKEIALGGSLGLVFGGVLWAFEAAGQIIDGKAGTTSTQVNDPAAGQQVSLNGLFFAKLAAFVFMYSGGMLLLVGLIIESYSLWPLLKFKPVDMAVMLTLFEGEFGRIFLVAMLISAPVLVTLFAVDMSLGLINRFAPQLNLFSLAMSAKVWIASLIILVMLTGLVQQLLQELVARHQVTLQSLQTLFGR